MTASIRHSSAYAFVIAALFGAVFAYYAIDRAVAFAQFAVQQAIVAESAAIEASQEEKIAQARMATTTVRAIYVTSGTAKNPKKLEHLIGIVERTSLNAMVIDVKGDTSYLDDKMIEVVKKVREGGIYPIARVVIFKDHSFAKRFPDQALTYASGNFWRDNSGGTWIDPASRAYWAYIVDIARQAADIGFREINIDYVRFPTDGALSSIRYPVWDGKTPKAEIIASFFKYFNEELKKTHPHVKTSLDIFGYTFLSSGGLNIGQRLEDAMQHFDYIAPMVYPSHYSTGNFGVAVPASHPHLVISKTLQKGFAKLPQEYPRWHIRPWLQAFNLLGVEYNAYMMKEQIRALEDFGITEFYLWNAGNAYDRYESALK
ncbi:MAG: putative glycoside hydrolase [bacterium]|nr:putative glycoside hydrolase [bacterium]